MEQSKRILDPRGKQKKNRLSLAKRPSLDELRQGKLLFYNNTKVEFCNYVEIIPEIKKCFSELGITQFVDYRSTVRGLNREMLSARAEELAAMQPTAAVIALADMGVSPASTLLTIELEKRGVPCVLVTASPGKELATATAYYQAGSLCLFPLDLYQGTTAESIRNQIDSGFDFILQSLTGNESAVQNCAKLAFSLDSKMCESGLLEELEPTLEGKDDDAFSAVNRYFEQQHLTDGFPIVPPTVERYQAMLAYCPFAEDLVLAKNIGPAGCDITVRDVAVNAVMAGCKPQYLPILLTAFRAMADTRYNFLQSVTTSHPGGNMILVSGPIAQELEISSGQGCLGPGFTANATIGRAVNLVLINVCRSVPGICDLDCLASQAEFSYCFAENAELSPWKTINEEQYNSETTTVTVLKAEPPHDIIDFLSPTAADLVDTICDSCTTLGSNNSYIPGPLVVVVTPDHAALFERDGYTKEMVQEHIHRFAYHNWPDVQNRGLRPVRPKGFDDMHPIPVTRSPKDVKLVVAGGKGGHSGVILPWALHSEDITLPVLLPDGSAARTIEEFKR